MIAVISAPSTPLAWLRPRPPTFEMRDVAGHRPVLGHGILHAAWQRSPQAVSVAPRKDERAWSLRWSSHDAAWHATSLQRIADRRFARFAIDFVSPRPVFGGPRKKISHRKRDDRLDFASPEIARPIVLRDGRTCLSRNSTTTRLSLFYRDKHDAIVPCNAYCIVPFHRRCDQRPRNASGFTARTQARARVHVSLSGVAVFCILV